MGSIATNKSLTSTFSTAAARASGPPHGKQLPKPVGRIINIAKLDSFIPICLYNGTNAAVIIKIVVVPSPSSVTTLAVNAVTIIILKGSPFAFLIK